MASSRDKIVNAHIFNKRVIEDSAGENLFKVMLTEFDHQFFSHLNDIPLELMDKRDVVFHYYDFFIYLCRKYNGEDISTSYRFYYVYLSHPRKSYAKLTLVHRLRFGISYFLSTYTWRNPRSSEPSDLP